MVGGVARTDDLADFDGRTQSHPSRIHLFVARLSVSDNIMSYSTGHDFAASSLQLIISPYIPHIHITPHKRDNDRRWRP
jgi:hypothetical protein